MPKKKELAAKAQKSGSPAKQKKKGKTPSAKLPKQVAGVTIGKELRQAIEPVLRFAGHPMVSETLAAGLLAGASALSGKKAGSETASARKGADVASAFGAKGRSPVGLMLAVAAGEIASRIVAAYDSGGDDGGSERRTGGDDRRVAGGDRRSGEDRRAKTRTKEETKKPAKERRGQDRRSRPGERRTASDRRT